MESFKTSKAKASCVVTPDPCVLQLLSFLALQQGQAQIILMVLPSAVSALCHSVATSYFCFRPLQQHFKLGLFSPCRWWQLPVPHRVRNVLRRWGLCAVLMGFVIAVPDFIARKRAEDDTPALCPPRTVFPWSLVAVSEVG